MKEIPANWELSSVVILIQALLANRSFQRDYLLEK